MIQHAEENSATETERAVQKPQTPDESQAQAKKRAPELSTAKSTGPVWGKSVTTAQAWTPQNSTPSLAEIIAEESESKVAAQAAYSTDVSLAEMEAEQNRLFQSIQGEKNVVSPPPSETEETKVQGNVENVYGREEAAMLQMVMKQSLAEYKATNQHPDGKELDESEEVGDYSLDALNNGSVSEVDLSEAGETVQPLPPSSYHESSFREKILLDTSTHSVQSFSSAELFHRPEPILSKSMRSTLNASSRPHLLDREFSERTLKEIERTDITVDNPHLDEAARRRRLSVRPLPGRPSKSNSITQPAPVPPLTRSASGEPNQSRNVMMEEARKHLSTREVIEIEQALREADQAPASPSVLDGSRKLTSPRRQSNDMALPSPHSQRQAPTQSLRRTRSSQSPAGLRSTLSSRSQSPICNSTRSEMDVSMSYRAGNSIQSTNVATAIDSPADFLSEHEAAAIEAALREADALAERDSLMLAFQIQQEELSEMTRIQNRNSGRNPQGNVRVMTRGQLEHESQQVSGDYRDRNAGFIGAVSSTEPPRRHPLELPTSKRAGRASTPGMVTDLGPPERHPFEQEFYEEEAAAGFRMNAASSQQWSRLDRNTIIGPNNELRTKHDVHVQGQANAHYLGLDEDELGLRAHVGNQAFNSFRRSMNRTTKGVATHGTGRAGADSDAVKGKAMDSHARLQISRAINAGLIEHCNGAVKQGKEAIIYHADKGVGSQGHDVAVKIFKRITEFRGRGDYVDGDPRYMGQNFRRASEREQLEMWAEKEYRNLVRANRALVPVPTPLHYKENIVFMRFMGNDGWPAPQIRDLEMGKGRKKWDVLYTQAMESVRRLYVDARLVHGDLSEFNILVAPVFQVDNIIGSVEDKSNDLQLVIIDFGQAVDVRHPESMNLLRRDLERVKTFFTKQGVKTLAVDDAVEFVVNHIEAEYDDDDVVEA